MKQNKWKGFRWKRKVALLLSAAVAAMGVPSGTMAQQMAAEIEAAPVEAAGTETESVEMAEAAPVEAAETAPAEVAGAVSAELAGRGQVLADFDFDDGASGFSSEHAVATGEYELQDSYGSGAGKALYLDGSSSHYLTVTDKDGGSLLAGVEELTISYDMKPDRTSTNWVVFASPNGDTQAYKKERYLGIMENDGTTQVERYNNTNGRPSSPSASTGADWHHVDVVVSAADTAIYVNGIEQARVESAHKLKDVVGENGIFLIGKANWGSGEYFKGWIDNFRVYAQAYSKEELPVPSEEMAERILQQAADQVGNITIDDAFAKLPDFGKMVTWISNTPEVVIGEDGLTAQVTQPKEGEIPVRGTLTAVLTLYGKSIQKEVAVTVNPEISAESDYGYLMVHFIQDQNGYCEKIYLDISRGDNPEQWDTLNGGKPILASHLGTTGVRDPFLTYNPETGTYYIIATDLRVFGGDRAGWGTWQRNYSTKMNVWESKDLITWENLHQFDVALNQEGEKQAELGMMWAPEATWVPDYYGEGKGAFVVYWSSQVYDNPAHSGNSYARIMWGATTDFTQETYEFGGTFLDPGEARIDTTIIQDQGKTYHVTKNETNATIYMESTTDKEWWLPTAKWTTIQTRIGYEAYGAAEGPAVFKDHSPTGKRYLLIDADQQYRPLITENLDEGWEPLDLENWSLTDYTKHGGVISLTKGQYDTIRNADAVSVTEADLGKCTVKEGTKAEELLERMPRAEVNTAYGRGTAKVPVRWDLSKVDLEHEGVYRVEGTVLSIGANLDAWVGENHSTAYNAPGRQLYSTGAIHVTATVEVEKKADEDEPKPPVFVDVTGITMSKAAVTLAPGKSVSLKAEVAPSNATERKLSWSSSDSAVAEVVEIDGGMAKVTAKKAGSATITAESSNGKKAQCKVTVKVPVSKVKLNKSRLTLGVKEKFTLQATVLPKDATERKVSYGLSKKGIVTVSKGIVTAKKKGTVTITVSAGGKKAVCKVTVKAAPKKITLSAGKKTLKKGKTYQIKVKLPGNTASNKITYSSSKKSVARVSASGKVKAVKKGEAVITVKTFNGKKAKVRIRVK